MIRSVAPAAWPFPFDDDAEEPPVRQLSKGEVDALRLREPVLSPWRVVLAQVAIGALAAALAWMIAGRLAAVSALYGAAVVVLPGALMARGATSRLSSISPLVSALSMLGWGFVKMALTVAMLVLAARAVPGLVWPAMLATMAVCLQSYWFALLWRGRAGGQG
ncbi:MAG: ATP synthase subunit I, partial [Caldimonas sp.]